MPELPEVQCFVNALNEKYQGRFLKNIKIHRDDIRFPLEKDELMRIFAKRTQLVGFSRLGKQILCETDKGGVFISLGMSGSFVYRNKTKASQIEKHEHVTLVFEDGDALGFVDPRRFGFWKIANAAARAEFHQIADPLNEASLRTLFSLERIKTSHRNIKQLLLDQAEIGGIGNIYALEALFRAKIHPERLCSELTPQEWNRLSRAIPPLLHEAIARGGSSISTYRNLHGESGGFQDLHRVYGREGESCSQRACPGIIVRIVQNGRSSWYCPICQSHPTAKHKKK